MESEANDSTATANALTLTVAGAARRRAVAGYIGLTDGGDYYCLGNLTAGTAITLGLTQPATSGRCRQVWRSSRARHALGGRATSTTAAT